jgi:DNA-binding MarR family transcriptional regulator
MMEIMTDEPRWLTPAQLREWTSLMALLMTVPAALDAQLKRDAGMNTFEYHVLVSLAAAPDNVLAMTDLAILANGSPSRLSHAVGRLERAGWVERGACAEAGRRTAARLTPAGMKKLEECAPGHVREVRRLVVDAIPAEQLEALGTAARAVVASTDPTAFEHLARSLAD